MFLCPQVIIQNNIAYEGLSNIIRHVTDVYQTAWKLNNPRVVGSQAVLLVLLLTSGWIIENKQMVNRERTYLFAFFLKEDRQCICYRSVPKGSQSNGEQMSMEL